MDPKDILPEGVTLRDFNDFTALRDDTFNTVAAGFEKRFPQEYGKYRIELNKVHYPESKDFDIKKQKDSLMKNQFLGRRLRGTFSLYNKESGDLLEEKDVTLMRVPYVTDRGTVIHNGNEYVTLNQARLSSGVYTRKKESGEIEAHVNAKRGTGKSYRVRLEPESSLYKLDLDQASLRLYSLLHDIGVSDDELELRWGPDILAINKGKYDSRVLDKAYNKLVRNKSDNASKEEKANAVREALNLTKLSKSSVERTLPNLFNEKAASVWRKFGFQQNPQMQNFNMAQTSDEFVKWDQKRQELEAKAQQKQEQAEFKRDLELRRKKLEIQGLNSDILNESGQVDPHAVIKQVMQNMANKQKTEKTIKTKKVTKELKHQSKQYIDKLKSEDKLQDRYHDIKDKAEQDRIERERENVLDQIRQSLPQQQMMEQPPIQDMLHQQPEMGMPEQPMMPKFANGKEAAVEPGTPLDELLKAKSESDKEQYHHKQMRLRKLMTAHPEDFFINSKEDQIYGITHKPTGFRMHLPKHVLADLPVPDESKNSIRDQAAKRLDVEKSAAKGRYKQSPTAEGKDIHTKVLPNGHEIDIIKLRDITSEKEKVTKSISDLKLNGANRSKATGFGSKRYEEANVEDAILVDGENNVIDGRHRIFKLQDSGVTDVDTILATQEDIAKAYVDNDMPDSSNNKAV